MTLKELLNHKNISGYSLSKGTGISYTTICDLINGKTNINNIALKHAILIADFLNIDVKELANLSTIDLVDFRYFRNSILSTLKRLGCERFVESIVNSKEIDFYYKNNGLDRALYLLATIDYLNRINNKPVYSNRYNKLRKKRLEKVFFPGSDLIKFESIDDAEKKLGIRVIPEFGQFNIIEEDIFNVA